MLAGKNGWLKIGGVGYPFRSWSLALQCNKVDTTSFNSAGFSEWIPGFTQGTVRAQGFLDPALQLTPGTQSLTVSLGIGTSAAAVAYACTFTGVVLSVTGSTKVDGAGEIEVEIGTNGPFTTTFAAA